MPAGPTGGFAVAMPWSDRLPDRQDLDGVRVDFLRQPRRVAIRPFLHVDRAAVLCPVQVNVHGPSCVSIHRVVVAVVFESGTRVSDFLDVVEVTSAYAQIAQLQLDGR